MATTTTQDFTATNEFYNPNTEHSEEDIKLVIQLADEEQKRRIADAHGESYRRTVAAQVSELFLNSLRATWFQRGSSFVLSLLKSVRQSGKEVIDSQPMRNFNAKVQVAGQKGVVVAQDLAHTVAVGAGAVGTKAQEAALTVKDKSINLAQSVSTKTTETAKDIKTKSVVAAQGIRTKSIETAQDTKGVIVEKVSEVTSKIRKAVTSMKLYKKLNKSFSNLAENTNVAFALLEEENERANRLNNSTETYAVLNAMAVSRLIKERFPENYDLSEQPRAFFATRLLEDNERARRMSDEKTAINNAKAISALISQKFAPAPVILAPAKAEVVEEIHVSKPLVATM